MRCCLGLCIPLGRGEPLFHRFCVGKNFFMPSCNSCTPCPVCPSRVSLDATGGCTDWVNSTATGISGDRRRSARFCVSSLPASTPAHCPLLSQLSARFCASSPGAKQNAFGKVPLCCFCKHPYVNRFTVLICRIRIFMPALLSGTTTCPAVKLLS